MSFIYTVYNHNWRNISTIYIYNKTSIKRNSLRGADKSLARPRRKQGTETEDFEFHIYTVYNHNWRNISTIYIHSKTSIKRNILIIKQNTWEVGRAKDLSAPRVLPHDKSFHLSMIVKEILIRVSSQCLLLPYIRKYHSVKDELR